MVASGFAGLGYQIVWTQQCALWLGHEAAAVLAVITAFFGGLGLGALGLAPRIERSTRPERWYAGCEIAIALWSLALAVLLAPLSDWMLSLTGAQPSPWWQWSVAFFGTFFVLLPATAAMGATLPAMERVMAQFNPARRYLPALYAGNTFGAVLGVLGTAFWLVPRLGLLRTAAICAACNVACAFAALNLPGMRLRTPTITATRGGNAGLWLLAATGLLGIGYEVLVVRVLSQVAQDTVYTFAMLLAVYLVGSACGAALYQRWLLGRFDADKLRDRLLCLQALSCLAGASSLWAAEHLMQRVQEAFGPGMAVALAGEAAIGIAAFALPTLVMGALFSHLCLQAKSAHHSFGRSLGFNTFGAAAAPLLCGVLLVPALGAKYSLLLVAGGYLALASSRTQSRVWYGGTAAAGLALALWAPPLAFIEVPPGGQVLSYSEGTMAAVSVVADASGVARLRINNRQQEGSSATLFTDARQALLPLLLHPSPRRALFLGLGTGVTASSAARELTLQVDAVELLPEVIEASSHFTGSFTHGAAHSRLHVMAADARRFVRTTDQRYDVIVSDNFHPARSGSGSLYTVEHFRAVRQRLTGEGVFCQWLPLHQLDLGSLRSIVKSFIAANPEGWAMLATNSLETPVLGLIARRGEPGFRLAEVRARLAHASLLQHLPDFGLADTYALLGGFVAGPKALAQFAAEAELNTDDHPVVSHLAPRITYAPDSLPRDRLLTLLHAVHISPGELLGAETDRAVAQRLAAYWSARDSFIEAGQHVKPTANLQHMLAQVREPLLAVLRTSPDFRPAYDPLLRMAIELQRSDAAGARALLTALAQVQPERPEAATALRGFELALAR